MDDERLAQDLVDGVARIQGGQRVLEDHLHMAPVGERAAARPELVREVLRRGHELGNHSQSHPQARFWRLGPRALLREIDDCQQALAAIAGAPPRWYRSVVGMTNPFVAAALRRHGLARVIGQPDYRSAMPAYEGVLSDAEILAALSWIKSRWPPAVRARHDAVNAQARGAGD